MGLRQRRSLMVVLVVIVLVVAVVLGAAWQSFDPGHKHDTSTDLMTPTLSTRDVMVFEVSPDESQVDFTTEVRGVALEGVFPVKEGTITLEPVGNELRVLVRLNIDVDSVDTGSTMVDRVLRAAMATGDYPIAFYVASSRELVPVTEEEITFTLDGDLEVHNVAHAHSMAVKAQLIQGHMQAVATSDLDLAEHGVEFPAIVGSTVIKLTARLQAYETPTGTSTPMPPG
jgi:polyisoprenoid-binding protein YceI